jgi:hypothetical protein
MKKVKPEPYVLARMKSEIPERKNIVKEKEIQIILTILERAGMRLYATLVPTPYRREAVLYFDTSFKYQMNRRKNKVEPVVKVLKEYGYNVDYKCKNGKTSVYIILLDLDPKTGFWWITRDEPIGPVHMMKRKTPRTY